MNSSDDVKRREVGRWRDGKIECSAAIDRIEGC